MNHFLIAMLKLSFLAFVVLGVFTLAVGVVLALFPAVLVRLLRWSLVAGLWVGGATLLGGGLYGSIIAVKLHLQGRQ